MIMTTNIAIIKDDESNLELTDSKPLKSVFRAVHFDDDCNIQYAEDPDGNGLKQEWWSEEELNEALEKDVKNSRKEELQQRRKNRRDSYDKRGLSQYIDQGSRHAASHKYVKSIVQKSRKLKIGKKDKKNHGKEEENNAEEDMNNQVDSNRSVDNQTDSNRSVNKEQQQEAEQEQPQPQSQEQEQKKAKKRRNTFTGKHSDQDQEQATSTPHKSRGRRFTLTGVIRKSIHTIKLGGGHHHHRSSSSVENPHEALQEYATNKSQPNAEKAVQIAKRHEAEAMNIYKELLTAIKEGKEQYPGAAAAKTAAGAAAASKEFQTNNNKKSKKNTKDNSPEEEHNKEDEDEERSERMRRSIDDQVRKSVNKLQASITHIDITDLPPVPAPEPGFFRQISI